MGCLISDVFFCIVETTTFTYFFESFIKAKKIHNSYIVTFCAILLSDMFITFGDTAFYIKLAVLIGICEFTLILLYNDSIIKKTYAVIIAVFLIIAPNMLIIYSISWVVNYTSSDFTGSYDDIKIITNVLIKTLQFILLNIILNIRKKKKIVLRNRYLIFYFLILFFSVFAIIVIWDDFLNKKLNVIVYIYITVSIITADLVIYIILYSFSEIRQKDFDIQMKNITIEQQQKDNKNISHEYYETLKIKHDINKYINFAIALAENNEYDKLQEYLNSFQKNTIGTMKTYIHTNYKMFNAVINKKLSEAEEKEIKIECCLYDNLNDFDNMEELELCIIFSNLLDNAIEAEEKNNNPEIRFSIFKKAGYVCFKVENTVRDSYFLSLNPDLKTTKKDKSAHGLGLKTVKEIVKKHDGIFNISQKSNWVCAEIMLVY